VITMSGPIGQGDAAKFIAFMNSMPSTDRVFGFMLHSSGGYIDEAETIAKFLRKRHALTMVGDGNICASACFLVFAAGGIKSAHPRSKIIVQANSSTTGGLDNLSLLAATTAMARAAAELGVPEAIVRRISILPPGQQVVPLSQDELRSMGVDIVHD